MKNMFYSHQTSSTKHHLTETHEHNFEIDNIALSSQGISLKLDVLLPTPMPYCYCLIANVYTSRYITENYIYTMGVGWLGPFFNILIF